MRDIKLSFPCKVNNRVQQLNCKSGLLHVDTQTVPAHSFPPVVCPVWEKKKPLLFFGESKQIADCSLCAYGNKVTVFGRNVTTYPPNLKTLQQGGNQQSVCT